MSQSLDFTPLERALQTLQDAQVRPPQNDLERDGVIQRFEYTFELCWKSIRKALLFLGRAEVSGSPKPLFRDAMEEHFIGTIEPWFAYLELGMRRPTFTTVTRQKKFLTLFRGLQYTLRHC